jgi:hypothetical protein
MLIIQTTSATSNNIVFKLGVTHNKKQSGQYYFGESDIFYIYCAAALSCATSIFVFCFDDYFAVPAVEPTSLRGIILSNGRTEASALLAPIGRMLFVVRKACHGVAL